MNANPAPGFLPADQRALWTQVAFIMVCCLAMLILFSEILQLDLLSRAATVGISDGQAASNDTRLKVLNFVHAILVLAAAAAFLIWFHAVHRNLPGLGGRELKYSPAWAVGGFFVPFLNLVRPVQVMREVWHASNPAGTERDLSETGPSIRNEMATPTLVGWWWGLYLMSEIFGVLANQIATAKDQTLAGFRTSTILTMISRVSEISSAICAMVIVSRITAWQTSRRNRLVHEPVMAEPEVPEVVAS